jgi:hypothetical protein
LEHPLDGLATSEGSKKAAYAVEYFHTSAFVHCSQPALDNYYPREREAFRVLASSGEFYKCGQAGLFVVLCHLHEVIAYALFGMNLEGPQELSTLFSDALQSLSNCMRPATRRDGRNT